MINDKTINPMNSGIITTNILWGNVLNQSIDSGIKNITTMYQI